MNGDDNNTLSTSLSTSAQSAANVAKEGILRAVNIVHNSIPQWSPHLQGHNPNTSDTSSINTDNINDPLNSDTFSLGSTATIDTATTNPVLPPPVPSSSTASRSRAGSFGNSPGGIFGFSLGGNNTNKTNTNGKQTSNTTNNNNTKETPPATPARGNNNNDKNTTNATPGIASLLSPGSFLTPSKNTTGTPSANNNTDNEKIDYKKIGEMMNKLKTANNNLMNAKRVIDDLKIKLTTADNVKKYLAEKVKEAEETTAKTIADKDAALFEKNQNVEVMMFLDEKVLTLENQINEQNQIIKQKNEEVSTLQQSLQDIQKDMDKITSVAQTKEHNLTININTLTSQNELLEEEKNNYYNQLQEVLSKINMLEQLTLNTDFMLNTTNNNNDTTTSKSNDTPKLNKPIKKNEKSGSVLSNSDQSIGLTLSPETPNTTGTMTKTAYQQHIDNLTAELMTARTEIANQKKLLDTVAAEKHKAGSTLSSNTNPAWTSDKSEITQLKLDLVRARKERDDAKVALLTANADIDDWKQKYNTLKNKSTSSTTTTSTPVTSVENTSSSALGAKEEEIKQLQADNTKLKAELLDIQEQHNKQDIAVQERITTLENDKLTMEKEVHQLQQQIQELQKKLQEQNESNGNAVIASVNQTASVSNGTDTSALQAQIDKLTADHHAAETTWKFQRTTLAKEIKKLRAEKDELLQRLGEPTQG